MNFFGDSFDVSECIKEKKNPCHKPHNGCPQPCPKPHKECPPCHKPHKECYPCPKPHKECPPCPKPHKECHKPCDTFRKIDCNVKFAENVIVNGCFRAKGTATFDCNLNVGSDIDTCGNINAVNINATEINTQHVNACHVKVEEFLEVKGCTRLESVEAESLKLCGDLEVKGCSDFGYVNVKDKLYVHEDVFVKGNQMIKGSLRVDGGFYPSIKIINKENCSNEYEVGCDDFTLIVVDSIDILLPDNNRGQLLNIKNLNPTYCLKVKGSFYKACERVVNPMSGIQIQNDGHVWHVLTNLSC